MDDCLRTLVSWDYLIIGAGSAGCALAHELASSVSNRTILILEAGGSDRSPFIKIPAGQLRSIATHSWTYRSEPDPSRNGAFESWSGGRVLGGSSSINGTMFVRGAARDFERWGWSSIEVMALFRDMERSDQPGLLRGQSGPLYVRTVKDPHAATSAFIESTCMSGYTFNTDYNAETQEGVSYAQLSQYKGFRCSAADAFLKPLLGKKNVKLVLNARVQKIDMVQGRAIGVEVCHAGKITRETAGDIIVCAGAIKTPQLLKLSGIGDSQELRRHNIPVAVDLPGVGRSLRDHPLINLTYRANIQTYNLTGGFRQKIGIATRFLRTREGPVANLFEGVAFLKSSDTEPIPDIQLHFMPVGYLPAASGTDALANCPAVTFFLNKSYPKSAGQVMLSSRNPEDPPRIECRLLEDADVNTLVKGIHVVRDIVRTGSLSRILGAEITQGSEAYSDSALQEFVRTSTSISYHAAGTCRMGSTNDAVVGPDLLVHGTNNLWVADASIMPDLISGNTNATCMMIGMKLGRQLVSRNS